MALNSLSILTLECMIGQGFKASGCLCTRNVATVDNDNASDGEYVVGVVILSIKIVITSAKGVYKIVAINIFSIFWNNGHLFEW